MEYPEGPNADGKAATALEDADVQRIWRVVEFLRSQTRADLLTEILPATTPAPVVAEIARHTRVAHVSVLVFPSGPGSVAAQLTALGLTPGPPWPSPVVRGRLARSYGLPEADLHVQIVHAALPGADSHATDLELVLCPIPVRSGDRFRRLLRDERQADYETYFALQILAPEPDLTGRLWELLTGPAGMTSDGGGFIPSSGPATASPGGCTALYLRAGGLISPRGWLRRIKLLLDGHHDPHMGRP
ncbi:hypothetical protein GCM10029978_066670 [Actinoallomurus acanthiterrae]